MRIPSDDTLSRVLVIKWLLQSLALCLYNNVGNTFGADGVLTLVGGQGIGKSSLCRKLGLNSRLCKTGLNVDPHCKDDLIKATSCFIGELGEVESTFKRDIAALKAFITAESDEVRRPYGRSTEKHLRRTSFVATCNTVDFLVDPTGNRRFWTIPCGERFNLDELERLDVIQLWAQVHETLLKQGIQSFRLSPTEMELLERRNKSHTAGLPAQAEVEDILTDERQNPNKYTWKYTTVSDFAAYYVMLNKFNARTIGKALEVCGIESQKKRVNGRPSKVRYVPIPKRNQF